MIEILVSNNNEEHDVYSKLENVNPSSNIFPHKSFQTIEEFAAGHLLEVGWGDGSE